MLIFSLEYFYTENVECLFKGTRDEIKKTPPPLLHAIFSFIALSVQK